MQELTQMSFQEEVIENEGVVLVDFWAPWCGPCRMVAPILEEVDRDYEGLAKVVKVNVDENPELSSQFNVMSIPTLIIFKNGQPVDGAVGALPKAAIEAKLEQWVR
jgi:thioredoxin 1